jgi:hypothetical protein
MTYLVNVVDDLSSIFAKQSLSNHAKGRADQCKEAAAKQL